MATSTRFVVAVHTLAILAVNPGKPVKSAVIAGSANTNPTVIRALLARMTQAGLTRSALGAGGGALLAKPAAKIRLLDVYQAVEQEVFFSLHRSAPSARCPIGSRIQSVLAPTLARASSSLERELAAVTLASVAKDLVRSGRNVSAAT